MALRGGAEDGLAMVQLPNGWIRYECEVDNHVGRRVVVVYATSRFGPEDLLKLVPGVVDLQ